MRAAILVILASAAVHAADGTAIAMQTYGDAVRGSAVAIAPDQHVRSGRSLAQLRVLDAEGTVVTLNPNSEIHLQRRALPDGHDGLFICLDEGAIQVNVGAKGPYREVHVLGAALDITDVGTLFVVEKVARDTDFVAVVRGKVSVRLRQEVSEAVAKGASDHAELGERQGVSGGANGMGVVQSLSSRPQLGGVTSSISEHGGAPPGPGGGDWDVDDAQTIIDASGPVISPDDGVIDEILGHVDDSIVQSIETQVHNDVINQTIGSGGGLGLPPGPP
jgi:hypothetical protein